MRSLLAVAEHRALTSAAERIGLSQPALSRRMQQLEEYFDTELFVRSRQGVELTEMGQLVATEARVLVSRYDSLRERVQSHVNLNAGVVRIGGGATAVSFLLPNAIASYRARYPDIRFHLKEAGSREITSDVASGELELGVITLPVAPTHEMTITPLMTDQVVLVARRDHALAKRGRLRQPGKQLSGLAYVGFEAGSAIRQIIDAALRAAGVEMNVVMELRSIPAILRMVATTGDLAFVSQASLEGQTEIVPVPVQGLRIERQLAVISRRDGSLSPAAQSFLHSLASGK